MAPSGCDCVGEKGSGRVIKEKLTVVLKFGLVMVCMEWRDFLS